MRNRVFFILLVVVLAFTGCSSNNSASKGEQAEMIKYMKNKYNQRFTVDSYKAGKKLNKTRSSAYLKDDKGNKVLVKAEEQDGKYIDNYISVINSDKTKQLLSELLSEFYTDCKINTNLYQGIKYKGTDKNISLENYLLDSNNGMRAVVYINSNDNVETQRQKIKAFSEKLKNNNIKVEALYFAFFDDSLDVKSINVDYSYEYVLDAISRNSKYSASIVNAYDLMWDNNKDNYNYMQKK